MSVTPVSNKLQLSSSLKERLKKCGRYHSSPVPVVGETRSGREAAHTDGMSTGPPSAKRLRCLTETGNSDNSDVTDVSKSNSDEKNATPVLWKVLQLTEASLSSPNRSVESENNSDLNVEQLAQSQSSFLSTPVTQRSRSDVKVRGSKLSFENTDNKTSRAESVAETDHVKLADCLKDAGEKTATAKTSCENALCTKQSVSEETISRSLLSKELAEREEELRKLRLVKMYRSKNNLEELQSLIDKWREVSQQAIQDLHSAMPEPKPSLTELINHLGIDHQLLRFKSTDEEDSFY